MKNFTYVARDFKGARKEGHKQGQSSTDVLNWLSQQGFTPISITEIAQSTAAEKQKNTRATKKRIKSADLSALCWQLTTLIEGGIPITTALDTISEDIENVYLQHVLKQIVEKVEKGQSFSESMAEFPHVFSRLACAMILAGETGGNLPVTLRRLAEHFDSRDKLAKKVKGAMAYPIFVMTFIVLIVVFIMTFIIPRFKIIFDQFGGKLPAFTQAFMGFYDMMRHNIVYILGTLLIIIVSLISIYTRTKKGHLLFCRLFLSLPLFGKIISQAFIVMFCRTMATLVSAGVSVLEVFDILAGMASNDIIRNAVVKTKENIIEGSNISLSMINAGFFPNMVIKMVQVGEESGSLSNVLERTASFYERKVDTAITALMSLLEPLLIVTVGAIVLVVVLALYLPIFSMST